MKFIDKTILALFSIIILLISMVLCFFTLDWIELDTIKDVLKAIKDFKGITICVSVVLILLSIKGIFFKAKTSTKEKSADGILLKNENGKLVISKETVENIVNGVAKGFSGTQNVSTKLSVINNNISVLVNLQIVGDISISALSIDLQNKIKEAVKRITNLELKEVNIRVKNISDIQPKTVVEKKEKPVKSEEAQLSEEKEGN